MQSTNKKLPNVVQTLESREGTPVRYVAHVGANRAQRRREVFGREAVAARKQQVHKVALSVVVALRRLGKLAS